MALDSWIEYSYSHFFMRDIAYTYSGGLFICILEFSLIGEIRLPAEFSLNLFGFLFSSYILGIGLTAFIPRFNSIIKITKYKIYDEKSEKFGPYKNGLVFMHYLIKKYDVRIINFMERYENLRVIGLSTGATLFFGGLLTLLSPVMLPLRSPLRTLFNLPYKAEYEVISPTSLIIIYGLAILGILLGLWILKEVEGLDKDIKNNNDQLVAHI